MSLAGPVPNDIQRLAYEAFNLAGPVIDDEAVDAAIEEAVAHEASAYADLVGRCSPGQRRVLVALAVGTDSPTFSAAFARHAGLAGGSSVKRIIDALEADELIVGHDRTWKIADPFLAAWLRPAAGGDANR